METQGNKISSRDPGPVAYLENYEEACKGFLQFAEHLFYKCCLCYFIPYLQLCLSVLDQHLLL
jgi:hypothetical protein